MANASKRPHPDDSDSEWEYEYSATETETFYATIDISSLGPNHPTHGGSRAKRQKPSTPALTTRAKKAQSQHASHKAAVDEDAAATEADNDGNETTQQGNGTEAEADPLAETGIDEADGVSEAEMFKTLGEGNYGANVDRSKIQILDLHTANPIINYLGTIYSCSWTTPLGTDIILTTEPDDMHRNPNNHYGAASSTLYPETDTTGRYTLNHSARIKQDEKTKLEQHENGVEGHAKDNAPPHPILAFSQLRLMAQPMKPVPLSEEKRGKAKRGRPRKEPVVDRGATTAATTDITAQNGGDVQAIPDMTPANDVDENTGDVPVRARSPSPSQQLLQSPPPSPASANQPQVLEAVESVSGPAITAQAVAPPGGTSNPASSPPADRPLSAAKQPSKPPTSAIKPPTQTSRTAAPVDLSAVLTPDSSHARTAQMTFLERLINAKKSLGETDEVTVYASKVYTGTGWRSQERLRKAAARKEQETETAQIEDRGENNGVGGDGVGEAANNGGAGAGDSNAQLSRQEERSIRATTTRVAPRQGYGTSGKVRRKPGRPKTVHWKAGDTTRDWSDDDNDNGSGERAGREGSETVRDSPTAATPIRTTGGNKGDPLAGADAIAGQDGISPVPNDLHNPASVVAEALEPPRLTSAGAAPHLIDVPEDTVKPRNDGNASPTDIEMGNR